MQKYGDLCIPLNDHSFKDVVAALEATADQPWQRSEEYEERIGQQQFCFLYRPSAGEFQAGLWLAPREQENVLYVTNVVPMGGTSSLSKGQYNAILAEFETDVVQPALEVLGLESELSTFVEITDWISPEAREKLKMFSIGANKSTGTTHPADRDRWLEFVLLVHREGSELPAHILEEWLVEHEWTTDQAWEVISNFEYAQDILAAYDRTH
jgi:hypothetical protein